MNFVLLLPKVSSMESYMVDTTGTQSCNCRYRMEDIYSSIWDIQIPGDQRPSGWGMVGQQPMGWDSTPAISWEARFDDDEASSDATGKIPRFVSCIALLDNALSDGPLGDRCS